MKNNKSRLIVVGMRFNRGTCDYSRRDLVRNTLVFEEYMIRKPLVKTVDAAQFFCLGHVEQMNQKKVLDMSGLVKLGVF